MKLRLVVSHPSRKNKYAARMGHPEFVFYERKANAGSSTRFARSG
jgi:hypothetical protein